VDEADLPDGESINLKDPASKLFIDHLMAALPNDTVYLNSRVHRIEYGEGGEYRPTYKYLFPVDTNTSTAPIVIRMHNGAPIEADHVLVTVSAGVLKAEHAQMFYPPLPSYKQAAIEDVGFDTLDKIFFTFDEQFWGDEEYIQLGAPVEDIDKAVGRIIHQRIIMYFFRQVSWTYSLRPAMPCIY
jgi:hypothetical protein